MKLEMNRAWNRAMALIGVNKDVVLIVAGVFFFLPYLGLMLAVPSTSMTLTDPARSEAAMEQLGAFYGDFWWVMLLLVLVQGIGMLGLLALLTDHRRPTVGEALKIGVGKLLPYLAAYLLVAVALAVVFTLFVAVGAASGSTALTALTTILGLVLIAYVFVKVSLVPPVMVSEGVTNPIAALRRSWGLTKGNSLRIFGFYFLLILVLVIVMMLLSLVVGLALGLLGPEAQQFGNALVSATLNAIYVTGFLAVLAAVHDQLGGTGSAEISETFE